MTIARPAEDARSVAATSRPAQAGLISIVMPCLNEAETVGVCVNKAVGWLARSGYQGEVIVVDNGSTDGSPELAEAAGARVVHEAARGYGEALRRGFAEARGDWLIMGDCDDTYEFSSLDDLVRPLADGADMVVGNRFAGGIARGAMTWSHRYIGTPAITLLLRMFAGLRVGDSQCGLRAFTRGALDRLELKTGGMELASEMILKAARRGLNVADVPVPYNERVGEAKLNTFRDGWRHLRFLLLSSPHYMFTLPGIVLTVLGMLTLGFSLPSNTIEIADWTWQPIFAGGIFFVVGINALLLGFASSSYTTSRGITNEDVFVRFHRRYLGLETLIAAGGAFVIAGLALDVLLAAYTPDSISPLALAAVAQALIIAGCNIVLVAALSSLIED